MQIQWPYRKKNRAAGLTPSQALVRPLRAELFSDELLRRHAIGLAGRHRLEPFSEITVDTGVLDESRPFLEGPPVSADEESYYDLPQRSGDTGTLYAHCVRAIEHGLRFGEHGLPLIGSGDWNDGMNLVGVQLEGEQLRLRPRLPSDRPSIKLHYRFRDTFYHITVTRHGDAGPARLLLDGQEQPDGLIHLVDDRHDHTVELTV
jgi:cellobiose phosphorylase